MAKFRVYLRQTTTAEIEVEADSIEEIEYAWENNTELGEELTNALETSFELDSEITSIKELKDNAFDREFFIDFFNKEGCLEEIFYLFADKKKASECEKELYALSDNYTGYSSWDRFVEKELKVMQKYEEYLKPNYKKI